MSCVYLLEDDQSICDLVSCSLSLNGIECDCFLTAGEFYAALKNKTPDVCLLDIMLPDANGFDVLSYVKTNYPSSYCIMLSALKSETDKVKGLNMGADDYVAKPFGILELSARINVALRKIKNTQSGLPLTVGNLVIDGDRMTVTLDGKPLELNKKEFRLLHYAASHAGKVLSREQMLSAVWGYEQGETRTVDNHVARLRKLGIDNFETVFGVGYKFKEK